MSSSRALVVLSSWAGLLLAPAAWFASTQLGQILPYLDCQQQARFSAVASVVGFAVACLAGVASWRSARSAGISLSFPLGFVGLTSALAALVFAYALSLQVLASLVVNACER